jgi:hypothetical protein
LAEDEEYDINNTGTEGTSTPLECINSEETSQLSATTSATLCSHKYKHTEQQSPAPLPFQKGHNFWLMVDKLFFIRMHADKLGTSWSSVGWAKQATFS